MGREVGYVWIISTQPGRGGENRRNGSVLWDITQVGELLADLTVEGHNGGISGSTGLKKEGEKE